MGVSLVYFIPVDEQNTQEEISGKLSRLLEGSNAFDFLRPKDRAALKIHFGEEGNTGYVKPCFARVICSEVSQKGAQAFLSDTNTLYRGRRLTSSEHLKLAHEHGFSEEATGARIIIPDNTVEENVAEVPVDGTFVKSAKVARIFLDADALVGIAHFKGHLMTGFGGALKNIGMGCASREGKLAQHSDISPYVIEKNCTACAACFEVCPASAISLKNKKAVIDNRLCIGCASCIAACRFEAIDVKWEAGGGVIQEKMAEYALAVLQGKRGKSFFVNFAVKITKECDCLAKDDPRIAPDVGILASPDPVALDKASLDLVLQRAQKDVFRQAHPERDATKQLHHAASLGVGNLDYRIITIS